jgi:hypothetical protein
MFMGDTGAGIVGPYPQDREQEQIMATTSGIGGDISDTSPKPKKNLKYDW